MLTCPVPRKAQGGKFGKRETVKPRSGLDIDALLGAQPKKTKISEENAIPDFKKMLRDAKEDLSSKKRRSSWVVSSAKISRKAMSYHLYGQAQEKLRVMREELINYDEPNTYNLSHKGAQEEYSERRTERRQERHVDRIRASRTTRLDHGKRI